MKHARKAKEKGKQGKNRMMETERYSSHFALVRFDIEVGNYLI